MHPLIGAALISGGGGLLSGIFGGLGKKAEMKQQYGEEYKAWEKMRNKRISDLKSSPLKPELDRYAVEKDLPAFDKMLKQLAIGRMGEAFGQEELSGYGINIQDLLGGLQAGPQQQQQQYGQPAQGIGPGKRMPFYDRIEDMERRRFGRGEEYANY